VISISQAYRIGSTEINHYIYGQVIVNMGDRQVNGERIVFLTKDTWMTTSHMQQFKNEAAFLPYYNLCKS
jgi:hypothetical protein